MSNIDRIKRLIRHPFRTTVNHVRWMRIQNKTHYESLLPQVCSYEENESFLGRETDIKAIALYLPQYHEFKENNEWWGEGFTEWTNVRKGHPVVKEHNQPRVPHNDFGYYDLSEVENVRKQVELAKEHGIYAFGMYHYWFSGHRLMEKPMDIILENPDIDFKFFAIWANENFTRTWDGLNNEVLLAQEYAKDDPSLFIDDLAKYLKDGRYMRVDGMPVIGLYNPSAIPDASEVLSAWKERAKEIGVGDILIWTCSTEDIAEGKPYSIFVDGEYEFPPRGKFFIEHEAMPRNGMAFDYVDLVEKSRLYPYVPFETKQAMFRGSMMEWDNYARKQKDYVTWKNYSPYRFYVWNRIDVGYLRENFERDKRFLFVNAWNEWGEGTYLEPDEGYGYAAINALSRAIFDLPFPSRDNALVHYLGAFRTDERREASLRELEGTKIAIHAHVFYEDIAKELEGYLENMPLPFSLFITTDSDSKAEYLRGIFSEMPKIDKVIIDVLDNQGRDVLPMIKQMEAHICEYDLFCHIHTKKSLYDSLGDDWRCYLLENVLGSEDLVVDILSFFKENQDAGLLFPQTFGPIAHHMEWGDSDKPIATEALGLLGIDYQLPDDVLFPAGNMFWARTDAVKDLFNTVLLQMWRDGDDGAIDGTIMHAIERLWGYVALNNGYDFMMTRNVRDGFPLEDLLVENLSEG